MDRCCSERWTHKIIRRFGQTFDQSGCRMGLIPRGLVRVELHDVSYSNSLSETIVVSDWKVGQSGIGLGWQEGLYERNMREGANVRK